MSVSRSKLHFLESILKSNGVLVRYEKGNFQSGYCLLKEKKVAVVNKFFKTPARTRILKEIVTQVFIDPETMTADEQEALDRLVPRWREYEIFAQELQTA